MLHMQIKEVWGFEATLFTETAKYSKERFIQKYLWLCLSTPKSQPLSVVTVIKFRRNEFEVFT